MTSKLVVNTIEADTGISSVSFASSISLSSTSKFHFSAAGIDIDADTNINRPTAGVIGFNINSSEKARIDSSGRVLIGTTTEGEAGADDLTIATTGHTGITIRSGTSSNGNIQFADGTSGDAQYRGIISYNHSSDFMRFFTSGSEKLRITSAGKLLVGTTTEGSSGVDNLILYRNGNGGITIRNNSNQNGNIFFSRGTSGTDEYKGYIQYQHAQDVMAFGTGHTERLRIDSNGRLIIGHTATYAVAGHYPAFQLSGTTYNGATLGIINNANDATGAYIQLSKQRSGSPAGATIVQDDDLVGQITFTAADGTDLTSRTAEIKGHVDGTPGSNDTPGRLSFWTTPDGAQSSSERLRIYSGGQVGIRNTNATSFNGGGDDLVIGNATDGQDAGITLYSHSSDNGSIFFNDTADTGLTGLIQYRHGEDAMRFVVATQERLRIKSDGKVLIGGTLGLGGATSNPSGLLHCQAPSGEAVVNILGATNAVIQLSGYNGDSTIQFGDSSSDSTGKINYDHGGDDFIFTAGGNTRGRIYNDAGVTGIEHHQFHPFLIGYDAQTSSDITMVKRFGGMSCIPINADGDKAFMSYTTHWRHREYALVRFWYGASGNTSGATFDWDFTVWSATNNEGYSVGSNHTFTVQSGSMSNGKMYGYNMVSSWPSHHGSELVQFEIEYDELQGGTSLQLVGLELVEYTTT